jgi:polyribonucleotide nucleotidyltransferase
MLGAVMFGHKNFQPVIDAIIKLAEVAAKEPRDFHRAGSILLLEAAILKVARSDELQRLLTRSRRQAEALQRR